MRPQSSHPDASMNRGKAFPRSSILSMTTISPLIPCPLPTIHWEPVATAIERCTATWSFFAKSEIAVHSNEVLAAEDASPCGAGQTFLGTLE